MKKNLTELVFILDRSGSMGGLEQDTTDGLENASKRFGYEKIRRMIEREKEQYGWEFLFLGANMDAVKEAARFGISSDRAVRFENDAQGVAVNYHAVSETVSRMREAPCCASIGAEWKEQIEADFQKRHHIGKGGNSHVRSNLG